MMKPKTKCGRTTTAISRPLETISLAKCSVTQVGAVFAENLTFEEWASVGKSLNRASEAIKWALGDWLNYGWTRFVGALDEDAQIQRKQRYKVALEALPYEYQTLQDIGWISHAIPLSLRSEKLSFAHHREVAPLKKKEMERYLRVAIKKGLSVVELRALIRSERAQIPDHEVLVLDTSYTRFITPAAMLLRQQPPETLPADERLRRKQALQPFVDYYNRC